MAEKWSIPISSREIINWRATSSFTKFDRVSKFCCRKEESSAMRLYSRNHAEFAFQVNRIKRHHCGGTHPWPGHISSGGSTASHVSCRKPDPQTRCLNWHKSASTRDNPTRFYSEKQNPLARFPDFPISASSTYVYRLRSPRDVSDVFA